MEAIKQFWLALVFCLILIAGPHLICQEKTAPPAASPGEGKSFIRTELLRVRTAERSLPKRSIFSPRSSAGQSVTPLPGTPGQGLSKAHLNEEEKSAGSGAAEQPEFSINLRYIGYIDSPSRRIALVFLDNQAIAVAEGEVIREGIRVGKISLAWIEIVFPDSTTKKFSLEGE